jgi:outer membrane biosynthesis protein TonB
LSSSKRIKITLFASLLLHLIFVAAFRPVSLLDGLLVKEQQSEPDPPPIEFELVPDQQRELVETPADAATDKVPQETPFLSDKTARARDENPATTPENVPFSDGRTEYRVFAGGEGQLGSIPQPQETQKQTEQNEQQKEQDDSKTVESEIEPEIVQGQDDPQAVRQQQKTQPFSPDRLRSGSRRQTANANSFTDDANWSQKEFSAKDLGGVSLNTYAWDFAPYILAMKRKIKNHVYPPPAFYQMGAIDGETVLRFRVQRDGTVTDLNVLDYKGHKTLMQTSVNAVNASQSFKPLPDDFPEKYLELTWTFVYSILR